MVRATRRASRAVRRYLVTIVTRLCLDQLDSARSKRVTYAGPWLPEPVVVDESSAAEQADYLRHFRADAIVRDAESIRRALPRIPFASTSWSGHSG